MQAAGELIVLVGEPAPACSLPEDQLHAGTPSSGWMSPACRDRRRSPRGLILVQDHLQIAGVTRQRLVDAVVDDLLAEVLGRVVSVYMPGRRRTGSRP